MPDEAELRRALKARPEDPDLWVALGDLMRELKRLEEAHDAYESAVALDPSKASTQRELGILCLDLGRSAKAVTPLRRSVALDPGDAKARNCLGFALERCGRHAEATRAFQACIDLDPGFAFAHINLVFALVHGNRIAEARRALDLALCRFPSESGLVLPEALVLEREGRLEEAIAKLESGTYDDDPATRLRAKHELARLYDRTGDAETAFRQFAAFNAESAAALGLTPERKAIYSRYLRAYSETVTEDWISSWRPVAAPVDSDSPVFFLGFARSGTTLLHQMMSCHPSVHAADEDPAIWQIEGGLRSKDPEFYPAGLASLYDAEATRLRQAYWTTHRNAPDWMERDVLFDKNPFAVPLVPLIVRLFPAARLVFAMRHPCDVVLSCFMHLSNWSLLAEHLFDLDDIVTLYTANMDLWERYEHVLPLTVHTLRYEELIEDPEATMRELLTFLGLPWDESVLRHHERAAESVVMRVPHHHQVLGPLHKRGRYRWHRYRRQLAPYLPRLEPYCRRFGYDL